MWNICFIIPKELHSNIEIPLIQIHSMRKISEELEAAKKCHKQYLLWKCQKQIIRISRDTKRKLNISSNFIFQVQTIFPQCKNREISLVMKIEVYLNLMEKKLKNISFIIYPIFPIFPRNSLFFSCFWHIIPLLIGTFFSE